MIGLHTLDTERHGLHAVALVALSQFNGAGTCDGAQSWEIAKEREWQLLGTSICKFSDLLCISHIVTGFVVANLESILWITVSTIHLRCGVSKQFEGFFSVRMM